jgi:hypothetical protein
MAESLVARAAKGVPARVLGIALWVPTLVGCTTTTATESVHDAAPAPSACELAGGQCGTSACTALGSQSCGAAGGTCCLDGLGALCAAEAGSHSIAVSSYSRSCQVDSDCVAIGVGNPCYPCEVMCPGTGAINITSLAQYMTDVADSPAGKAAVVCNCPQVPSPSACCNGGTCALHCLDLGDAPSESGVSVDAD